MSRSRTGQHNPNDQDPNDLYEAMMEALRGTGAAPRRLPPPPRLPSAGVRSSPPAAPDGRLASDRAPLAAADQAHQSAPPPAEQRTASSTAPIALEHRAESGPLVVAGLGTSTGRRRRLVALGLAAVALVAVGMYGTHRVTERAAVAVNPPHLWSLDAAGAVRSMVGMAEREAPEVRSALHEAPWIAALRAKAPTAASTPDTAEIDRIVTPITIVVTATEPSRRRLGGGSADTRSSAPEPAGVARRADGSSERLASEGPGGPLTRAAREPFPAAPDSIELEWTPPEQPTPPSTEQQLPPTSLRANQASRPTSLGWRPAPTR